MYPSYRFSNNKTGLVIFDFDGVLADSFDTLFPLIRDAMKSVGISLTKSQYCDFFIGGVHQGFRNFIKNNDKYSAFSEFRKNNYDKYYYDKNNKVKLFPGALKFLKKINKKYILTIASSGRQDNIKNLLEESGATNLFSWISANATYTKESMIKEILEKFHSKSQDTIMITDTIGDIKAAKRNNLKTIAVTWGFQPKELLTQNGPDFVADNFNELMNYLT